MNKLSSSIWFKTIGKRGFISIKLKLYSLTAAASNSTVQATASVQKNAIKIKEILAVPI